MKNKNSYAWLALFGLIPIVGLVIGIILLSKGTLLRNRILRYIGTACIVFNPLLIISLFYFGFKSAAGKEQMIRLAKFELNETMKEIELYKMENGQYPDSIQLLMIENKRVPVEDPMSESLFSSKFKFFCYKKIDSNHYTLFSAGFDQIPNTSDDIYPEMSLSQSHKFGLVKFGSSSPQN